MPKTISSRVILLLFVLALAGCDIQKNMLYYPDTYIPSQEAIAARYMAFWPDGQGDYRGFISTWQAGKKPKGTIVVFHGNAGTAADRTYYVSALASLGYRVILAEYPGYGGRKGKLGEETFVRDAKETLRLASEKYGAPIFLLGESLGCGVGAAVAKDPSVRIDGMILITPWDSLLSVAKEHFPWLPVRLFLRDKYDTISNLKDYKGRIAVIGAEQDEIVPIHHAQTLFASLRGDKKMWMIRGAGHNNWPEIVDPLWWQEIAAFMKGNPDS
jgi:pimeloyl-ACP methyl ester carboxylesterase